MKITTLKLVNFRNYDKVSLNFSNSLNVIYGNNGEGKTNLVEAIYTLSLTKSFRTNNDRLLIKQGEEFANISGIVKSDITNNYQIIISKDEKKVKINNDFQTKFSNYISKINVILLEPNEQVVLDASPQVRRKLLNIEISQLKQEYILLLNNYNKVLKQRNFYLRELYINGNRGTDYLDILTEKLIHYGMQIYEMRSNFINMINENIDKYYKEVFGYGDLKIVYESDYNNHSVEKIKEVYKNSFKRELALGKTIFGVHHDDMIFKLDSNELDEWGSNGQKKNAILAFKLAEIEVFKKEKNEVPILILDDIFSALDTNKVHNIIKKIDEKIQTFITTTDLKKINKKLLENAKLFKVKKGTIKEE